MKLYRYIILAISLLIVSCADKKTYSPSEVTVISEGLTDEGLVLTFSPMSESMYECPGVLYEKKGNQVEFWFVRRNINRKDTDVHLSSSIDADGNHTVIFPFAEGETEIELVDSHGTKLGKWTRITKS